MGDKLPEYFRIKRSRVRKVQGKMVCRKTARATPKNFRIDLEFSSLMPHFIPQLLSTFPTDLIQQSALLNCKAQPEQNTVT